MNRTNQPPPHVNMGSDFNTFSRSTRRQLLADAWKHHDGAETEQKRIRRILEHHGLAISDEDENDLAADLWRTGQDEMQERYDAEAREGYFDE